MRFKALVSPIALALGLGVGPAGAASAQTMINDVELTDEQIPYVESYCMDLGEEQEAGSGTATTGEEGTDDASDDAAADNDADDGAGDAADGEPALEDLPTSMIDFDLSALNIDDCREAGFID